MTIVNAMLSLHTQRCCGVNDDDDYVVVPLSTSIIIFENERAYRLMYRE